MLASTALEQRTLGRSGLRVSNLALGTVELGMAYGIPGPHGVAQPDAASARALLRAAVGAGITLFDTAPAYGTSESIVGEGLDGCSCVIATKVTPPSSADASRMSDAEIAAGVHASLERSRALLRRSTLDVVQIHNATVETIQRGAVAAALVEARARGTVRVIGASVYTEAEALAAISAGVYDVLQVPYSILDQRMATRVLPASRAAGVGIVTRSALLKGALTPRSEGLPAALAPIRDAALRARDYFGSWDALISGAMRFCLGSEGVSSVLIGAGTQQELRTAISAVALGPLPGEDVCALHSFTLTDETMYNPARWPVL